MEGKKTGRDAVDLAEAAARFLFVFFEEIFSGILKCRVPPAGIYSGILIAALFYWRVDQWVFSLLGASAALPERARVGFIYAALFSGWIFWGIRRAIDRNRLLSKLKDAFRAANLKCNGQFPALIEDVKIDDYVRKLRLHCHGVTKSAFEKATEQLEALLNLTVVRLLQEDDKSKIEIVYAMKDMPQKAVLENPDGYQDGEIPIGLSYDRQVHVNMRDVGHILVAGQTGGGKSNFLKTVTTILTRNNPEATVVFLDFKGGMETADLRNYAKNLGDNIMCFDGPKACVDELRRIGMSLEQRFQLLGSAGAASLDHYLKNNPAQRARTGILDRPDVERRLFLIIDEIAQLYARDPGLEKSAREAAKATVNRIARQGRAAGVHLIVATQKPDALSFDQTVKTNLPAVLCFPMPNQVSSVSAIGTKRAFEINPNIRGRAIWKFGPNLEEVQTYLFS